MKRTLRYATINHFKQKVAEQKQKETKRKQKVTKREKK